MKRIVGLRHEIHSEKRYVTYDYSFDSHKSTVLVDFESGRTIKNSSHPSLVFHTIFDDQQALRIFTEGRKIDFDLSVGIACVYPVYAQCNQNQQRKS